MCGMFTSRREVIGMSGVTLSYAIYTIAREDNDINKKIVKVKVYTNYYGSLMWGQGAGIEFTVEEVINEIETKSTEFITIIKDSSGKYEEGSKVFVYVDNGIKYIKTVSNSDKADNLENLPRYEI